jgi:hypothetical protein
VCGRSPLVRFRRPRFQPVPLPYWPPSPLSLPAAR